MSGQPNKKPNADRLFCAIDIERSGPTTKDILLAIGIASCVENRYKTSSSFNSTLLINSSYDVPKDGDWEFLWKQNGWHMPTYNEFWSKHLPLLTTIRNKQQQNYYCDEQAMAFMLNHILTVLESEHENITFVFDTAHYDATYLSGLLLKYECAPLHVKRDWTGYHSSVELDSFIDGVKLAKPDFEYTPAEQNHNPRVDAECILQNFFDVRKQLHNKQK
jgi:hypothetical protein